MKDELVLNNLNLIYLVLKQMNLYDKSDYYYDAGLFGLVKAANIYNPAKGYKFTSLATICIRNEILMSIRKHKNELDMYAISLDAPIADSNNGDVFLVDVIPDDFSIEDEIIKNEENELLHKAIATLNDEEQKILRCYYIEGLKQRDIAKKFNIAQPTVARKLKKIIKKLKDIMKY